MKKGINKLKEVHGSCQKLALQVKNMYVGVPMTVFGTDPIVPRYATDFICEHCCCCYIVMG
jgi:hypothetical protein